MKILRHSSAAILLLAIALIGCQKAATPPSPAVTPKIIEIQSGMGLRGMAKVLKEQGIIKHPRIFWLKAKALGKDKRLQAGEYALLPNSSDEDVLEILATGRVYRHRITVPEGSNLSEIATLLSESPLHVNAEAFLKKARDPAFMQRLGVPANNAEGFLFPSTYFFPKRYPISEMIAEMVGNFKKNYSPEMHARATTLGFTQLEVVTFASIIEKETGRAEERPLISSVFHNRLRRGMRLQSDPTTIYGIADFNGNLTRKDLQTYSPYNTYVIKGLPPGPITNPGLQALRAVLYPAESQYLFFVAHGNGTHEFTTNIRDHNKAVMEYQIKPHRRVRSVENHSGG